MSMDMGDASSPPRSVQVALSWLSPAERCAAGIRLRKERVVVLIIV